MNFRSSQNAGFCSIYLKKNYFGGGGGLAFLCLLRSDRTYYMIFPFKYKKGSKTK